MIDAGELVAREVTAEGFAYATFMAWQAAYASAAEFACGILVNFPAWGFNCAQVSVALKECYAFNDEDDGRELELSRNFLGRRVPGCGSAARLRRLSGSLAYGSLSWFFHCGRQKNGDRTEM